jgi:hypothetical protein
VENMFYIGGTASFPSGDLNRTHTVSSPCSRKSFFAKLGGAFATFGLVPALFARSTAAAKPISVVLRPESRAIARKEGTC